MMYHAWKRPGRKPSTVSSLLVVSRLGDRVEVRLTAKGDVDQTVSRADASLDPDRERREDYGDEAEEDVAAAHFGLML